MISTMNHISFTVSDLDRSVDFYERVLGLKCISLAERDECFSSDVTGLEGVKMDIAYIEVENCNIELIRYVKGEGKRLDTSTCNIGSAHVCFNVKDFDEWIDRMEKNGVEYRGKLCRVPAGPNKGKRVCYMIDNDGNNLEFIEDRG